MRIIEGPEWGRAYGHAGTEAERPAEYAFVHHLPNQAELFLRELQEDGVSDRQAEVNVLTRIERHHVLDLGWSGGGYNFVVFPSGRIYEMRGWGRVGAHVEEWNTGSIGVALCLDGREQVMPDPMVEALLWLVATGRAEGHLDPDFRVLGHQERGSTGCPGEKIMDQLHALEDDGEFDDEDDRYDPPDMEVRPGRPRPESERPEPMGEAEGPLSEDPRVKDAPWWKKPLRFILALAKRVFVRVLARRVGW